MSSNSDGYFVPVVLALVLHLLVASLFLLEWQTPEPVKPVPVHITARVIAVENQAEHKKKVEQQRPKEAQRKKVAEQARKDREAAAARKREAEKKAAEKAEQQRKLALKKAEEAKKAAEEKARQEREAQQLKEQQEKEARELAEMEQNMLEKLAQEEAAEELARQQEAERRAKLAARIETEYLARIRDQISSAWVYPPGVDPEQEVEVELSVVPTGEVVNIKILNGSGSQALDRSVEQAIINASPLPVPEDIRIFDASFRQFRMKFRPENATW